MPGELAKALAAAQAEFPDIPKDKVNPHFKSKYASLDGIIRAIRGPLSKHGLSLSGRFVPEGLEVLLLHVSGEERSSGPVPLLVGKNDMQGLGSSITYARRYGVGVVAGISPDEDDDGNAAAQAKPKGKPAEHPAPSTQAQRAKADPGVSIRATATPECLADLLKKWMAQKAVATDPAKWQATMESAEAHQLGMIEVGKWTKETSKASADVIMDIFRQLADAAQAAGTAS